MAFTWKPTGKDRRFLIDGLPNADPDHGVHRAIARCERPSHTVPAKVTAQPDQKDVRIVLDPKLVRGKK